MLSAFTEGSQINISLNAQSSAGKTFLPTEIAKFFPDDSKIIFNNATPTALFYGEGIFDKQRNARIINLERKILIFLEQPDLTLQANLRSILSHDSKESTYHRTNRSKTGANRAEKIIVKGFPATFFCSACGQIDEQEATRFLMLSPEDTPQKIESAIDEILITNSNPTYNNEIINHPSRIALIERVSLIQKMHIEDIIISNPDKIKTRFLEMVGGRFSKVRYMRDIAHIIRLIKAIALLNIWYREENGKYCANDTDIDEAFALWGSIAESQLLDIPPMTLNFYRQYIVPAYSKAKTLGYLGITVRDILDYYNVHTHNSFHEAYLRANILIPLHMAGLITYQINPNDHRQKIIIPMNSPVESKK